MAENTVVQYRELPLNGRLRTYSDPAELVSSDGKVTVIDYQTMQNLRYTDGHPQAIGGTTKVNTTVLANPQIKSMFQFRKDSPAESNVLVAARDSNGLNQKVYRNGTAIPSAGDFTAAALFTDTAGYGNPMFSTAPGEKSVYCNGKDTAIWGGSEMKPIGFIDMDPNGTYKYDYTEQVKNALSDANNVATLHRRADTSDAATMLLLHFDTDLTDSSPTTVHTVTANGNAAVSATQTKFGAKSCHFDGTGDYLSIPDNADFDLSGGIWTLDCWVYPTDLTAQRIIYHQQTDANNYMTIKLASLGTGPVYSNKIGVALSIYAASSEVVSIYTSHNAVVRDTWSHIAVVENGDSYYIFVNGFLYASGTDTSRAANYTSTVYIGSNTDAAKDFLGYIDEFRVSNSARWTAAFDPPTLAYGSSNVTTLYVVSQLPIQGVNPYVGTANTAAGAVTGNYWSATGWTSLGTVSGVGATPLSAAGKNTWTFTSTATTAKQKAIDDKVAYWYRFEITDCDTTTTIYQVTLDTPMQAMKELWDGAYRPCSSFLVYKNSTFNDYTVNVFQDSWTSTDTNTFVELDSLATATDYLVVGFTQRMMGFRTNLIGGHVNTTAGTTVTPYYYNGTGIATATASWTQLSTPDDGTANANISLAKSGSVTWTPPELASEFKVSISRSPITAIAGLDIRNTELRATQINSIMDKAAQNRPAMYYYKIAFSQNLSADVQAFFIGGIPAPEDVSGHKFAVHHVDRLWLWGDEKDPHRGFCTSKDTAQVLRGDDTVELFLKNTPVAGVSLFERYGSTAANVQLVCEPTRTWAIVGETVENFTPNCIDDANGCTAPLTMDVATVEILPATFRRVAIWQSQNAIVMSDGSAVTEISRDIRDKFDPKDANYVGASTLPTCTGGIDAVFNEYVWVIPGTTAWVYDILRKKWSERPLAATKRITCCRTVSDTNGIPYLYGATASGYVYRMDYGVTIDGLGIPYVLQLGDVAPTGNIMDRTEACSIRLIGKAKTTTAQTVLVEHFGDSSTTASVPAIPGISMSNTGKRLFSVIKSMGANPKNHVFHSIKTSITTTDETIGYEPIFMILGYRVIGKDTK